MPNILLNGHVSSQLKEVLLKLLDSKWHICVWDSKINSVEDFYEYCLETDILVSGSIPTPVMPNFKTLKLFQIPWAGYEFCTPGTVPKGVPVCNCYEHETTIAEYVLSGMLEFQVGLSEMNKRFKKKGWDYKRPGIFNFHHEIRGKKLGIFGYGRIGQEVARRAKAFDMEVIGIKRKLDVNLEYLDEVISNKNFQRVLPELDFLLVACDLNQETLGIVNKKSFDVMKRECVIINVGRGKIIKEKDLFEALKDKKIRGAVLDVWYNYVDENNANPKPSIYPFHLLDNVIMTGHESAGVKEMFERRANFIFKNIQAIMSNENPQNLLFYGESETGTKLKVQKDI